MIDYKSGENLIYEIKHFLKTVCCFIIACVLAPVFLLSFIVVHYTNKFLNFVLTIRYPNLIFSRSKKIRSLIDTPQNAGIFHFLLEVTGQPDFDKIKQRYEEHLTNARNKFGYLRYPKLRQQLITCWGHYAWVKDNSSFNLNNHIVLNTYKYRGRCVDDTNIQDFINELVKKYIPSDIPQWQVIVIPTTTTTTTATAGTINSNLDSQIAHYYILVKIHHLIIAEEENLHISEMLMLHDGAAAQPAVEFGELYPKVLKKSQLTHFVSKPEHIENLLHYICQMITNQWNKFVYKFESLETPDDADNQKRINNMTNLISILLIAIVKTFGNYYHMKSINQRHQSYHFKYPEATISQLLQKELKHYHLSWSLAKTVIWNTVQPKNLLKNLIQYIWLVNIKYLLLFPLAVYSEFVAIVEIMFKGQTRFNSSYSAQLSTYLPLVLYAHLEFVKICWEIFKAPVNIVEELFQYPSKEINILHMKSYSGRKIVSISKSIDGQRILERFKSNNHDGTDKDSCINESDFTLACLAAAIYDYFNIYSDTARIPNILNTSCRIIGKGYFTDSSGDKNDNIGGVIFLKLPLRIPGREHLRQIHRIVAQIRRKQIMLYLAAMGQTKYDLITAILPRILTKICINYFSFIFPVTITEIHGDNSEFRTLWGQKVRDVLLFRPPQSKTSLSLNVHRFGNKYRLAIIADTQLGPDHSQITRSFEYYMNNANV